MNKLLKEKGVVALLYNEVENLADMEYGEKSYLGSCGYLRETTSPRVRNILI
jgi:hypothetical protein